MSSEKTGDRRATGREDTADGRTRIVPMRLQRFLARAGVASRRGSEDLMTAGRVRVNGVVATELGTKVDPARDVVLVDDIPVALDAEPVYIALNKPPAVMTTMSDPQGRPTVASLAPVERHPGLFPVGRLDYETRGLLLFTTDGEFAHRVLHPRWKVKKTYDVRVDGQPSEDDLSRLREGVELDDGRTAPASVDARESDGSNTYEISIREGRKRQVRRMFSAIGHPVLELRRTDFGPVALGDLEEGAWRYLTEEEVAALRNAVDLGTGD